MTNVNETILIAANFCATETWEQMNSDQQGDLARDTNTGNFERSTSELPMQGDFDYVEGELAVEMDDEQNELFSGTYLATLEEIASNHYGEVVRGEDEAYAAKHGIEMSGVSFHRS